MAATPYFEAFADREPPSSSRFVGRQTSVWHMLAGATIGFGLWYLHWRWTASLNPDALVFSIAVAWAETMAFVGTLIFFFDIWSEGDTPKTSPPETRDAVCLDGDGDVLVDIYITSFDETPEVVAPSIEAAQTVIVPVNTQVNIVLLDDGNRDEMRELAESYGVTYIARQSNRGYKAGNLANALFATTGDFVAICDADTRLFPGFLENTLGYFRDPKVAWVQTPHWFYDIPEGMDWTDWLAERRSGRLAGFLAPVMRLVTGRNRVGTDPFLSDPAMFFDVIQRRRNRNHASFCCGAGSIHRREAIFENALDEQGRTLTRLDRRLGGDRMKSLLPRLDMQPFRYHVSEDIFTSMQLHSNGWKSIYHPNVEARMLSPWTMKAWATQKLKYAGGTYDLMLRSGLLFRRSLPWRIRMHYLATFWSYLGVLWLPILFAAPVISLVVGVAPVDAYSIVFFMHLVPLLAVNEMAMLAGSKAHDIHTGRILSLATMDIQLRALFLVLRGEKPRFPTTPKTPVLTGSLRYAVPNFVLLATMASAATYGLVQNFVGSPDHTTALVAVNCFWLAINAFAVVRVTLASFWRPRLPDGSLLQHAA